MGWATSSNNISYGPSRSLSVLLLYYTILYKYNDIFIEKNESLASHMFSTKNVGVFQILMFEILTKC